MAAQMCRPSFSAVHDDQQNLRGHTSAVISKLQTAVQPCWQRTYARQRPNTSHTPFILNSMFSNSLVSREKSGSQIRYALPIGFCITDKAMAGRSNSNVHSRRLVRLYIPWHMCDQRLPVHCFLTHIHL